MKKHCPRCNKDLPHDSFTKDRSRKDGLRSLCRECYNQYLKDNRKSWPSRSREARRQQWQNYEDNTKSERDARYRKHNKRKIAIRSKTYRKHRDTQKCSVDGCNEIAERHHLSYQNPDNFIWLCREHHLDIHER